MYNYVMLVGKVKKVHTEKVAGKELTHLILECQRAFPDADGKYITDKFDIRICDFMAEAAKKIKEGTVVNVKGRLLPIVGKSSLCMVIAERFIFLGGADDEIDIDGKKDC